VKFLGVQQVISARSALTRVPKTEDGISMVGDRSLEFDDHPESFLEVVGPGYTRMGSHDPVELYHQLAGQGVGVAQQRVSAAHDAGGIGGIGAGGCVLAWRAAGA
jgi:hypothetical protein